MAATCVAAPSPFPRVIAASAFKGNLDRLSSSASTVFTLSRPRPQSLVKPLICCRAAVLPARGTPSLTWPVRFRLDNLGPQRGSRKKRKRKGRGTSAGQGDSCGFGMKGQKSRSGPNLRKGFEGGQTPLYKRIPKLRGIAGGMRKGLPKFVHVNLRDIEAANFKEGEEVSLETLKMKRVINPSGRERKLPLKILGVGDLSVKLRVKAGSFSAAAKEKLESCGCSVTVLPGRKKYLKPSVVKNLARAIAFYAKKRSESLAATASGSSSDTPSPH